MSTLTTFGQLKSLWYSGRVTVAMRDTRRMVTQAEQTALHLKLLAAPRAAPKIAERIK